MARTIRKKLIDDDLMLSDDFDEKLLDKLDRRFETDGRVPGEEGSASPGAQREKSSISAQDFSLDDFENPSDKASNPFDAFESKGGDPSPSQPGAGKNGPSGADASGGARLAFKRVARNKLLVMAGVCLLVVTAVGFLAVQWWQRPRPAPQVTTLLRRAIDLPHRQQDMELLLLTTTPKEKSIISLKMKLDFVAPDDPNGAQNGDVAFRDVIFQYLRSVQPTENTTKYWAQIVRGDLFALLKATFPKSGLKSVSLSRFERL